MAPHWDNFHENHRKRLVIAFAMSVLPQGRL